MSAIVVARIRSLWRVTTEMVTSGEHGGLARERVIKEKHRVIHHDTSMTYFTMLQVSRRMRGGQSFKRAV